MTVKISKPALNLREELNKLDKPSGITGETLLRADTDADARATLGIDNFEQVSVSTDGVISADGLMSSGNLLVGTTEGIIWNQAATDTSKQGVVIEPKSIQISRFQDTPLLINRQGNTGNLQVFAQDGTNVGSIGVTSTELAIGGGDANLLFMPSDNAIAPSSTSSGGGSNGVLDLGRSARRFKDLYLSNKAHIGSGSLFDTGGDISLNQGSRGIRINDFASAISPTNGGASNSDATTDLGVSNIRFRNLYLSGGVYLGGTGAANKLDDYEEGTFTPTVAGDSTGVIDTGTQGSYYTKVGNLVTIYMNFRVTTNFTSSSIGGLPFQANHPGLTSSWLSCGPTLSSSTNTITAGIQNSTSVIRLYNNQNLSTPHVLNTPNAYHRFVFSYRT